LNLKGFPREILSLQRNACLQRRPYIAPGVHNRIPLMDLLIVLELGRHYKIERGRRFDRSIPRSVI
jgi:hypothetical protein